MQCKGNYDKPGLFERYKFHRKMRKLENHDVHWYQHSGHYFCYHDRCTQYWRSDGTPCDYHRRPLIAKGEV